MRPSEGVPLCLGARVNRCFFYAERSRSAAALHARFFNATLRRYSVAGVEPPASLARFPHGAHHPPTMTLQALPLWANATPAAQRGAVVRGLTDALERTEHHLLSGIVGTKFILPVLAQHGKLVRPRAHLFAALA